MKKCAKIFIIIMFILAFVSFIGEIVTVSINPEKSVTRHNMITWVVIGLLYLIGYCIMFFACVNKQDKLFKAEDRVFKLQNGLTDIKKITEEYIEDVDNVIKEKDKTIEELSNIIENLVEQNKELAVKNAITTILK